MMLRSILEFDLSKASFGIHTDIYFDKKFKLASRLRRQLHGLRRLKYGLLTSLKTVKLRDSESQLIKLTRCIISLLANPRSTSPN